MYVDRLAAAAGCALDLAWAKAGATAPNPPVGCVLLDAAGDTLVAASHERARAPHAEAAAIALCRAAGTLSRARAAVVTLEPCSHVGRTPPCVDALLATDIELILVGARDPHPRAPGRGIERLERAGWRVLPFSALDHPEAPLSGPVRRAFDRTLFQRVPARAPLRHRQDGAHRRGIDDPASRREDLHVTNLGAKIALDLAFHLWSIVLYRRWLGPGVRLSPLLALAAAVAEPFTFQLLRHAAAMWGWATFLFGQQTWGRQSRTGALG